MVSPTMKLEDFLIQMVGPVFKDHPEASKLDWRKATWEKGDKPWAPKLDQTVAENGLVHKEYLRFQTPGLNGYKGLGI